MTTQPPTNKEQKAIDAIANTFSDMAQEMKETAAIVKSTNENWEKIDCEKCKGYGFYADHDDSASHGEDGECISCPVQVQCEVCHGEGGYMTLDCVRSLLATEKKKSFNEGRNERYCFRRQRDECSCKEEDDSWDFWKEYILNEDGTVNMENLKKEISDLNHVVEQVPQIYMELTGGVLSKTGYWASQIIGLHNEELEKAFEQGREECEQEYQDTIATEKKALLDRVEGNLKVKVCGFTEDDESISFIDVEDIDAVFAKERENITICK